MHRAVLVLVLAVAAATTLASCAAAPPSTSLMQRDAPRSEAPQDVIARHAAHIEVQRARLGLDAPVPGAQAAGEAGAGDEAKTLRWDDVFELEGRSAVEPAEPTGVVVDGTDGVDAEQARAETWTSSVQPTQVPPPLPGVDAVPVDGCEDTCLLAQDICVSSATICEVADAHGAQAEFAETCRWAQSTCDESLEVCSACRQPIVQSE